MSLASTIGLTIQLPKFEGPLSLLLYLIKKEEMDIFDIEIHRITNQYFEYIRQMKEMDLEVAGEFVAMAATLIQIKSQLLLPQYNEQGEVIEVEDPRKELVQRLLEYQKFQEAARTLAERPWLGRDVWSRGFKEKWEELNEEIELEDNALFSLISSYRKAIRSVQKRIHKVAAKTQSVASRIMEIKDRLFINQRVAMGDLINSVDDRRRQVLMTFLSALELAKMGFVRLFQTEHQQEIYIEALKEIDASGISRVEEYEKVQDTPMNEGAAAFVAAAEVAEKSPSMEEDSQMELVPEMALSEDFVLADTGSEASLPEDEDLETLEMATDEEIEAAELELSGLEPAVADLEPESLTLEPETPTLESETLSMESAEAEIPSREEIQLEVEPDQSMLSQPTTEQNSEPILQDRSVASLTANAASLFAASFGETPKEVSTDSSTEKSAQLISDNEGEANGSQEI